MKELEAEAKEQEQGQKAPAQKVKPQPVSKEEELPQFPTVNKQAPVAEEDEDEEALKALQAEMGL